MRRQHARSLEESSGGISRGLTLLLAVACGTTAANLYYAQPLLETIGSGFHVGSSEAGLLVTLSQVGYATGLALVVPLGDLLNRRKLVPSALAVSSLALAASGLAPSITVLIVLAFLVGLGSVAAQVLVPLAASLANEESRGRIVGTVMSGLLLGILLARTVSGLVAQALGWRVVYWLAAAAVAVLAAVLARSLPKERPRERLSYVELLRSTATLLAKEPLLRRRAGFGALGFAAFSVFWTTGAFLLSGPPYHYPDSVIGLFGLVGAAGALCASFAGRLADRGLTAASTAVFAASMLVSFGLIWLGGHSLVFLVIGIVILDIGVQGMQVTNQSLVYRLSGSARSRANAAYMVCYFLGGALGSQIAAVVYSIWRWPGVSMLGAAIGAISIFGAVADWLRPPPYRGDAPARIGTSGISLGDAPGVASGHGARR